MQKNGGFAMSGARVDLFNKDGNRMALSRTGRFWMIAAVLAAMLLIFAANAGRMLVVDAPQPSDVILVLAGETDRRPARAFRLQQRSTILLCCNWLRSMCRIVRRRHQSESVQLRASRRGRNRTT